ncbi:MAG: DNA mismatch repair protein MutS [Flavobacteriaceae bacterium]|nr:DNA mismatch repair protein MutS [Flavobacteriaceae bacterium]
MKTFAIGDKVAVLDADMKGTVLKVSDNQIIINTEDGFSMDFTPKELVKIVNEQQELSKFSDIHMQQMLKEKQIESTKRTFKKSPKIDKLPAMEVDLHIHHLISSTRGMSNYEILSLQLEEAERKIQFAKSKKIQRVVFIHGVGEGVLQQALTDLFQKYQVDFYAAPFQKYGMGATEIYIYQNAKD